MKKFKFFYSPLVKILIILVCVIAAAGLIMNILTVINYAKNSALFTVLYGVLTILTALLLAEAVAIAFYGLYKIKDGYLYSYFGLIRSKTDVKEIVAVHVFKTTEKLVVYFKDEKYSVIIISPKYYDEFIAALLKVNPDIKYVSDGAELA